MGQSRGDAQLPLTWAAPVPVRACGGRFSLSRPRRAAQRWAAHSGSPEPSSPGLPLQTKEALTRVLGLPAMCDPEGENERPPKPL